MLRDKINQLAKHDGLIDIGIEGVELYKLSAPFEKINSILPPSICIIAQGCKNIYVGEQMWSYNENTYLIGTAKIPMESEIKGASPEHPYLGMLIHLDSAVISELLSNFNEPEQWEVNKKSEEIILTSELTERIESSLERLLDIANNPLDIKVLGKALIRELYFEILKTPQGYILRNSALNHLKAHEMVPTIKYLEQHFKQDISIDEIAKFSSMSVSSLHDKFKKATSLSPIQFIKQLRLHNARGLLLSGYNASSAAFESGYTSSSQFSREFKRLFGYSPRELKVG